MDFEKFEKTIQDFAVEYLSLSKKGDDKVVKHAKSKKRKIVDCQKEVADA